MKKCNISQNMCQSPNPMYCDSSLVLYLMSLCSKQQTLMCHIEQYASSGSIHSKRSNGCQGQSPYHKLHFTHVLHVLVY
jgi:hypothetical protein